MDTEYIFKYLIFRVYYFYNKHVYPQYQRSMKLNDLIQRQLVKCRKQIEEDGENDEYKNEYDLMISISSKINNNHINVNDYKDILETDSHNLTLIYTIARLFIKFCNFNEQYL